MPEAHFESVLILGMVELIEVVDAETLTCLTYFRWSLKTEVGAEKQDQQDRQSIHPSLQYGVGWP
jgi:hypothetical protein